MTFSIVARDPATGDVGIAIASKALAVGAVSPFARAGVGAISTQAMPNVAYGPDALDRLAAGEDAESHFRRADCGRLDGRPSPGRGRRRARPLRDLDGGQLHGLGRRPDRPGVASQGNILTGPEVVDAMLAAYESRHRDVSAPTPRGAPGGRPGRRRQARVASPRRCSSDARGAASAGRTTAGSISGSTTTRIP